MLFKFIKSLFIASVIVSLMATCGPLPEDYHKESQGEYDPYAEVPVAEDNSIPRSTGDIFDRDMELSREDYEKVLSPRTYKNIDNAKKSPPPIPRISDILATPKSPVIGKNKYVSISVTEDVPLKDVLIEISRLAEIDVEIDTGISGGIIFSVENKPVNEVIERVCNLAGLRYYIKDGVVRIERDSPYVKNYQVDFLNLIRSNTGTVAVNTQVLSGTVGGGSTAGGGALSSGSTNSITSSYEGDIWLSIEEGLTNIMNYAEANLSSNTDSDESDSPDVATRFSLNRTAGIITLFGTEKQHKKVSTYLESLRDSVSKQVLIEAKIVEVTLNKDFKSGVDWSFLDGKTGINMNNAFDPFETAANNLVTLTLNKNFSLGSAVKLLDNFGTSRTLSSPRINAMNNQQAVLTFAENRVFFTFDAEREEETTAGGSDFARVTVDSEINTIPIGVILTLQPSINAQTNEITMNVRPTISASKSSVNDPAVDILVGQVNAEILDVDPTADTLSVTSSIPIVEVKELDSILKIKSGEVMVIGGLIEEKATNEDNGVPVVSRIPIVGNLFKSQSRTKETVETVIFIKATIVPSRGVEKRDEQLYKTFTRDPNPLAF